MTALQNSVVQTVSSSAAQSVVNGDSFTDSLKNSTKNLLINAVGELGANEIGTNYHAGDISKVEQLTLHAALGCGMAAAGGNNCGAGAASGVIGEEIGSLIYNKTSFNREQTSLVSQVGGALGAAMIAGPDDGNSVFAGGQIGWNAAHNNATYVSKETKRVVAADGENDHKVILVDESEYREISDKRTEYLLANNKVPDVNEALTGVVTVSTDYKNHTKGEFYNLTLKSDFETLAKMTGQFGMSYSPETTNMIFNSNDGTDMTKIFFQNGMDNNYKSALSSAKLIQNLTGQDVGLIVNTTGGIGSDVAEYLPTNLYLKDTLNGEVYQQIANNSDGKSLVIMHSAGNNDSYQAAQILKLNNANLNGKIDFISVGSPVSTSNLRSALGEVGGNVIGGYNNILDPVTHSKTWAVGALTLFGAGVYVGATTGVGVTTTGTGLEAFGSGLIGGGIGGGAIVGGIKLQHPFETYFNKDFKGLASDIQQWSNKNQ